MPAAPLRPCIGRPTCPNRVRSGRCASCAREKEHDRPHLEARRWYRTARWRALRSLVQREQPLCDDCERIGRVRVGEEVDHTIPHRGDALVFWDRANLRNKCKPCHSAKTQRGE